MNGADIVSELIKPSTDFTTVIARPGNIWLIGRATREELDRRGEAGPPENYLRGTIHVLIQDGDGFANPDTEGCEGHVPVFTALWERQSGDFAVQLVNAWGNGVLIGAEDEETLAILSAITDQLKAGQPFTVANTEYRLTGEGAQNLRVYRADELSLEPLRPRSTPRITKPPRLLPRHSQQTFAEAKAAARALAAGPSGRGWVPVDGEVALAYKAERDSPLSVKFIAGPIAAWMQRPQTAETLRDMLPRMGIPAVILFHVCVGELLERLEVTAALDQLITAIGWQPRSTAQRQEMRARVWEWLVTFEAWQIIGRRHGVYRDAKTKQARDLTTVDAVIRITGRAYADATQLTLGDSTPPDEVTFVAGPWLNQWRNDHQVLAYFGEIQQIGAIPGGKPSGAWAQAIGLALQQRWRELAAYRAAPARVGDSKRLTVRFQHNFTRRELLSLFPPSPTVEEILNSPNPKRAQTYWKEAITLLRDRHILGHCREREKLTTRRQEWANAWLDQPLDMRPVGEAIEAIASIAEHTRVRRRRGGSAAKKSPTAGAS